MKRSDIWLTLIRSEIASSVIAILLVGGAVWISVNGQALPDWMTAAVFTVLGFFFGTKSTDVGIRREDVRELTNTINETLPKIKAIRDRKD